MTVRRTGEASSTIVASATETASGNSGSLAIFDRIGLSLHLLVDITATSGTPTLNLTIEWSNDGSKFVVPQGVDSFSELSTTGGAIKAFTIKAPFYRIVWVIAGGSPSLTFSIDEYTT